MSILKVYPHVCGGIDGQRPHAAVLHGLSPRVRGNPNYYDNPFFPLGSIPACAGESRQGQAVNLAAQVYPRVCGGIQRERGSNETGNGLSPRVRGNRCVGVGQRAPDGSIPACAGESSVPRRRSHTLRVYPRVCGGIGSRLSRMPVCNGLSPRVRGNRRCNPCEQLWLGSIPACAGESRVINELGLLIGVYPRVYGLSPRVRGNRLPAAA